MVERRTWPTPVGQPDGDESFLLELGELLRLSRSSSQLLFDVSALLAGYLGASRCMFSEIDRANERLVIDRDYHSDLPSMAGFRPFGEHSNETVAALSAGRVVVTCDSATDPRTARRFDDTFGPAGLRAWVMVPMFLDGRWVSSLGVCTHMPRVWEAREVALIQSVAERAWMSAEQLREVKALRDSEARKAAILACALDAIVSIDHLGQVVELNLAAERMFGRTAEDAIGRTLAELVVLPLAGGDPVDLARLLESDGGLLGALIELPAVRADGATFPAEMAMVAVAGVTPPLFTATLRDITERKRSVERELSRGFDERVAEQTQELAVARRTLCRSEANLRVVIETALDGILVHRSGPIVHVNPALLRMLGHRDHQELVGRPVIDLVHPDHRDDVLTRIRRLRRRGVPGELLESRLVDAFGAACWVETSATSIEFDGEPAELLMFREISGRPGAHRDGRARRPRSGRLVEPEDRQEVALLVP